MGLSIHYDGRLKKGVELKELIDEVIDVCKSLNWSHQEFNDSLPKDNAGQMLLKQELFGIAFTPPKCETVFITFETNGRLNNLFKKAIGDNETDPYYYTNHVKTQYAGIEVHKKVIHLFKYLSEKYFSEFNMTDEGEYWETGDEKILEQIFDRYNKLFDMVSMKLQQPKRIGESVEEFIERVLTDDSDFKNKITE